jgi:hypothetical protein
MLLKRKKKIKKHHDLIAALRNAPPDLGLHLWACYHFAEEEHFLREYPKGGQPGRQPWPPRGPCPLYKGNCWKTMYSCLQMEGGVPLPMDWWVLRPPFQALLLSINVEEPQATIMVEKQKVIFLLDSGAHFSVFPFSPGAQCNDKFIIWVISGQALERYFTQLLTCSWGGLHFCHSFLIVPETPVPLLDGIYYFN